MALYLILVALCIFAISGVPGLFMSSRTITSQRIACGMHLAGLLLSFTGILLFFYDTSTTTLIFFWPVFSDAVLSIDALSAFFLVPVFGMGFLGSLYGLGYHPQNRHPSNSKKLSFFWGLLVAGMALLVISKHAVVFLLGWELMALSAFFLVSTEDNRSESRHAGLTYLIAAHVGTLILFFMFSLWHHVTGSYILQPIPSGSMGFGLMNLFFILSVIGFGLKAGIMPFHFWLPAAHATAPSHVSAILSGVVLKMGIYGLVRWLSLFPDPPNAWGTIIVVLGLISGLFGVVFAIAQHDLKRLLAYHSIENIGIIMIGFGIALIGRAADKPELVFLGMAGCLLHVWNHSFFKSLLFFGAGAVVHHSHTRQIDKLGGLFRQMPWVATLFFIGAVAICGLPPLNGFVSEFFIYMGLFGMVIHDTGYIAAACGVPVLAMVGALAAACFIKVYGAVFLGNSRTSLSWHGGDPSFTMRSPMIVLALFCLTIGMMPILIDTCLSSAVKAWDPVTVSAINSVGTLVPLRMQSMIALLLVLGTTLIAVLLRFRRPKDARSGTWDCGYARPVHSMQYTASSFAHTIVHTFRWLLAPREHAPRVDDIFPEPARYESHVNELILDRVIHPFVSKVQRRSLWFRRFQQGLVQQYILYILLILFVLLGTQIPFSDYIVHWFTR